MEGYGEGMVAVIQGNKLNGLTVTVLPNKLLEKTQRCDENGMGVTKTFSAVITPTRASLSNVETNTENFKTTNDDFKTSNSSKFPSCGTQSPSVDVPATPPLVKHRVSSAISRQDNFFVESLRKYPTASNVSSKELIQRVLRRKKTRNLIRRPYSKSARSLLHRAGTQSVRKVRKWFEPETPSAFLNRCEKSVEPSFPERQSSSQNEQLKYMYDYLGGGSRGMEVRYITEIKRTIKNCFKNLVEDKPSVRACSKLQSRYNDHKKKHHLDSSDHLIFSNDCIDPEAVTSELTLEAIQKKYCYCHKPRKCVCKKISKAITRLEDFETILMDWVRSLPIDPNSSLTDILVQKKVISEPLQSLRRLKRDENFDLNAERVIRKVLDSLPIRKPSDLMEQDKLLKKLVHNLLDKLNTSTRFQEKELQTPENVLFDVTESDIKEILNNLLLLSNLKPTDMFKLEKEIFELLESLKKLTVDEHFYYNAKKEIKKYLDAMPIRKPSDRIARNRFLSKLANDLFNELKRKSSFFEENSLIGDNYAWHKYKWRDNEELFDVTQSNIKDLVKSLPLDPYLNSTDLNKIEKEILRLFESLRRSAFYEHLDLNTMEIIRNYLNTLPIKAPSNWIERDRLLNKLANDLSEELTRIYMNFKESSPTNDNYDNWWLNNKGLFNVTEDDIKDLINSLPLCLYLSSADMFEIEHKVSELLESLKTLKSDKYFDFNAKNIIKRYLDALPITTPSDKSKRDKFLDKLSSDLLGELRRKHYMLNLKKALFDITESDIKDMAKSLPLHHDLKTPDLSKLEIEMTKLFNSLKNVQWNKHFIPNVKKEIRKCLDILPIQKPRDLKERYSFLEKITNDILSRLMKKCKPFKESSLTYDNSDDIADIVKSCIPIYSNSKTVDRLKLEKDISDLVQSLKGLELNENFDINAKKVIEKYVNSFRNQKPSDLKEHNYYINKLSNDLLDELTRKKPGFQKNSKNLQPRDNILSNMANDITERDIRNIVQSLPLRPDLQTNDLIKLQIRVRKLLESIKRLKSDKNFISNARKEIKKCLDTLPIKKPTDSTEQDIFFDKVTNDILAELTKKQNSRKSNSNSSQNRLKVLSDILSDRDIEDLLEALPLHPSLTTDKLKLEKGITELKESLRGLNLDKDFDLNAEKEIKIHLDALPIRKPSDSEERYRFLNKLTFDLLDRLIKKITAHQNKTTNFQTSEKVNGSKERIQTRNNYDSEWGEVKNIFDVLERHLKSIVQSLTFHSDFNLVDNLKVENEISVLIDSLKRFNLDENFNRNAKKEIISFLETLPIKKPNDVKGRVIFLNKLVNDILDELTKYDRAFYEMKNDSQACGKTVDNIKASRRASDDFTPEWHDSKNAFGVTEKKLKEVIKSSPLFSDLNSSDRFQLENGISKLLNSLKRLKIDKYFVQNAKKAITDFLDTLPIEKPIDSNERVNFLKNAASNILDELTETNRAFNEMKNDLQTRGAKEKFPNLTEPIKYLPLSSNNHPTNSLKLKNALPIKQPSDIKEKTSFLNNLANDLLKKLTEANTDFHEMGSNLQTCEKNVDVAKANKQVSNSINKETIQSLPLSSDLNTRNRNHLENSITKLLDSLKKIELDEDFNQNVQTEMKTYLDARPIRKPSYIREQTNFNNNLASDLLSNLTERNKQFPEMENNLQTSGTKVDDAKASRKVSKSNTSELLENKNAFGVTEVNLKQIIQSLPISSDLNMEDKIKLENGITELLDSLKNLKLDKNFDRNAKTEIKAYLDTLPIRKPSDIKKQASFLNNLANELFKKLAKSSRDVHEMENNLQSRETENDITKASRQGSYIYSSEQLDNKNAFDVTERNLKEIIQTLPLSSNLNTIDRCKLENDISKLLNSLKKLTLDKNFDQNAKMEIKAYLNTLPIRKPSDIKKQASFLNNLANDILEKLTETTKTIHELTNDLKTCEKNVVNMASSNNDDSDLRDDKSAFGITERKLKEIIQSLPLFTDFNTYDRYKLENGLSKLLDSLKRLKLDKDYNQKATKEIRKCLDTLPIRKPSDTKERRSYLNNLANDLVEKLTETSRALREMEKNLQTRDTNFDSTKTSRLESDFYNPYWRVNKKVFDIIEKKLKEIILSLSSDINMADRFKLENGIFELLNSLKRLKLDKYFDQNAKKEITKCLDTLPIKKPSNVKERTRFLNNLASMILEKIIETNKEMENKVQTSRNKGDDAKKSRQASDDTVPKWRETKNIMDVFERKLKEILKSLPVSTDFNSIDRLKLENVILELLDSLKELRLDKNFSQNAENEIKKCLNNLPIRKPSDLGEKSSFFNKLTKAILDKLTKKNKGDQELAHGLGIPSNKTNTDNKNAFDFTESEVKDLVQSLSHNFSLSSSDRFMLEQGIFELLDVIKRFKLDENFGYNAKEEIKNCLNTLPIKKPSDFQERDTFHDKLGKKILDFLTMKCTFFKLSDENIESFDNNDSEWTKGKNMLDATETEEKDIVKSLPDYHTLNSIDRIKIEAGISELLESLRGLKLDDKFASVVREKLSELKKYFKDKAVQLIVSGVDGEQLHNKDEVIEKLAQIIEKNATMIDGEGEILARDIVNEVENVLKQNVLSTSLGVISTKEKSLETRRFPRNQKDQTPLRDDTQCQQEDMPQMRLDLNKNNVPLIEENLNVHDIPRHTEDRSKDSNNNDHEFSSLPKHMITSTPYTSLDKSFEEMITKIDMSNVDNSNTPIHFETNQKYLPRLESVIKNWLQQFHPCRHDNSIKNLVTDVAKDVIERWKYLQLSQNKPSDDEELEYFKFLMFRLLTKVKDVDRESLTSILFKVHDLYKHIRFFQKLIKQDVELNKKFIQPEILKWIEALPKSVMRSISRFHTEKLTDELLERINPFEISVNSENDEKIAKWLQQVLKEPKKEDLDEFVEIFKDNLKNIISNLNKQNKLTESRVKNTIIDWTKQLPLDKRHDDVNKKVNDLVQDVSQFVSRQGMRVKEQELVNAIANKLVDIPIYGKKDNKYFHEQISNLLSKLKSTLNENSNTESVLNQFSSIIKSDSNFLNKSIERWCNNLPIYVGDTSEDKERECAIKQNVIIRILSKISELNMDPEIFNNDLLYEDILEAEIDKLLNNVPLKRKNKDNISLYKFLLKEKLKEVKQKVKEHLKNVSYKQIMRDTVSKTLSPYIENLTIEEENNLENLKNNLVDAFIKLHYISNEEKLQNKYKEKLLNELGQFCNDYLRRSIPLNSSEIHRQLLNALQKVPAPDEKYLESEIEQIEIKDIIHDWLNNMFEDDHSLEGLIHNDLISLLSNRLQSIIKKTEDLNNEGKIRNEVIKWFQKLPDDVCNYIGDNTIQTNSLIDTLKATERLKNMKPPYITKSYSTLFNRRNKPNKINMKGKQDKKGNLLSGHKTKPVLGTRKESVLNSIHQQDSTFAGSVDAETQVENLNEKQCLDQATEISPLGQSSFSQEVIPEVITKHFFWNSSVSSQSSNIILPQISKTTRDTSESARSQNKNMVAEDQNGIRDLRKNIRRTSLIMTSTSFKPTDSQKEYPKKSMILESQKESTKGPLEYQIPQIPSLERNRAVENQRLQDVGLGDQSLPQEDEVLNRFIKKHLPYLRTDKGNLCPGVRCPDFRQEKRRVLSKDADIEQDRLIEEICCKCRKRILTKCSAKRHRCSRTNIECSKICRLNTSFDGHCPYPCKLYFM